MPISDNARTSRRPVPLQCEKCRALIGPDARCEYEPIRAEGSVMFSGFTGRHLDPCDDDKLAIRSNKTAAELKDEEIALAVQRGDAAEVIP